MTKLNSHLKKGFISILSLTLILSSLNVYAINDNINVIIKEDNLDDTNISNDDITTLNKENSILNNQEINSINVDNQDDIMLLFSKLKEYEVDLGVDILSAWNNWTPISMYENGTMKYPGQWSYNSSGYIVNAENTDNMTGFYNPTTNYSNMDISISMGSWDGDDDYMGVMIRFSEDKDHNCTGYVFMMPNTVNAWPSTSTYGAGLYKITGKQLSFNNLTKCVGVSDLYWTHSAYRTVRIVTSGNNIKVYVDGTLYANYTDTNAIETGSYGFFSISQPDARFKEITGKATLTHFTATFNANDGILSGNETKIVTSTKKYGTLPTATRIGYTFDGWYDAKTGGNQITSQNTVDISSDTTFYAHWTPVESTVNFDANGGSVSTTSKKVYYNQTMGTMPTPTRTGYAFKNWCTDKNGAGGVITSDYKISWTTSTTSTLYAQWTPINYTISYNLNGGSASNKTSYTIETNTFTLANPTKTGYTFVGWTGSNGSTKQTSVSIAKGSTSNKSYTANYSINQYDVTYIDVVDSINGTQLGKTTKKVNYNSTVRGSDIGSSTSDNAYYNGYYYSSDTNATVTTSGATIYRIFKLRTIDKTSNLTWNDNNNKNGFRPSKYTLKLLRNGALFKQVELTSSQTSYTFSNLTKYDSNGNAFKYTFQVDASDRYKITLDSNGNTITENYQNSTFSVTIPKTISLNGFTGKGNYNVKVSGTFYYNDTLTVTPSSSFALKDKNNINTLQANVTQNVNTFTKNNLGSTSGSISLNKTKFAGKYDGTFNFNIKFTLKN